MISLIFWRWITNLVSMANPSVSRLQAQPKRLITSTLFSYLVETIKTITSMKHYQQDHLLVVVATNLTQKALQSLRWINHLLVKCSKRKLGKTQCIEEYLHCQMIRATKDLNPIIVSYLNSIIMMITCQHPQIRRN